jgi:hypothetical protein
MSSRLTLSEVRAQLYKFVTPTDPDDPDFLASLNRVCANLFDRGVWVGLTPIVDIAVEDGHIVLPRFCLSVLGAQFDGIPVPTEGRYYEFTSDGPGQVEAESGLSNIIDVGETPLERELLEDSVVTVQTVGSDRSVRLFGFDADGLEVHTAGVDGIVVAGTTVGVASSTVFSSITGVQILTGTASVKLKVGSRILASYRATETIPLYRRYKVSAPNVEAVRALCKRKFVPLAAETDFVYPANLAAIKQGLLAEIWENQNDFKNSETYWGLAEASLNRQVRSQRGGAKIRVKYSMPPPVLTTY